jgi:hypothetical protein
VHVHRNSRLGGCFLFAANVDGRGGVVTRENQGQSRRAACRRGEGRDGRFQFLFDGRRNRGAIQQTGNRD